MMGLGQMGKHNDFICTGPTYKVNVRIIPAVGILLRNPRNSWQEDLSDVVVDDLHDIIPLFNSCITVYRN